MKYSELAGKEIVDIDEGVRLGVVNETDLILDLTTGTIRSIVIPYRRSLFNRKELIIPWHGIKKIGVDLIIVDLSTIEERDPTDDSRRPFQDER